MRCAPSEVITEAAKSDLSPFTGAVLAHVSEDEEATYVLRQIETVKVDGLPFNYEISRGGKRVFRTQELTDARAILHSLGGRPGPRSRTRPRFRRMRKRGGRFTVGDRQYPSEGAALSAAQLQASRAGAPVTP